MADVEYIFTTKEEGSFTVEFEEYTVAVDRKLGVKITHDDMTELGPTEVHFPDLRMFMHAMRRVSAAIVDEYGEF